MSVVRKKYDGRGLFRGTSQTNVDRSMIPRLIHDVPSDGRPVVRSVPLCPSASDVFGPRLAERLEVLSGMVAARIPVGGGEPCPEDPRDRRSHCFACGAIRPGTGNARQYGWVARPLSGFSGNIPEVYCGDCFERWGWPS